MNTNVLIKAFLETLKEEKEKELEDKVSIITKLFNNFKKEKDDNYNTFKEFINEKECLCHIKGYAEVINSLSDDEIKQVINNTGLTKDEFFKFTNILITKVNEVRNDIIITIAALETKFQNQFDVEVNFETMSKEELIDYIKNNK